MLLATVSGNGRDSLSIDTAPFANPFFVVNVTLDGGGTATLKLRR